MRIVVTGATGNVGTSVLRALEDDPAVTEIVGLSRRKPDLTLAKTRFHQVDIVRDDLVEVFRGADAVIHLAFLIQPARDREKTRSVNVGGARAVADAAVAAGVERLVVASSVGAYSKGPKDRPVDESWPTGGTPSSFYATDKADVERLLDDYEDRIRVVRLRPGLVFKADAASEIRRYFAGPLLPRFLLRRGLIPVVPAMERLVFQAVHSWDLGEAFRLAATEDVRGAFNVAADPVLDPEALGRLLGARPVPVPPRVLRALADLTWRAHLQPTPAGWLDLALNIPVMDTTRARTELGWTPRHGADDALLELIDAMRRGDGLATPPLRPAAS